MTSRLNAAIDRLTPRGLRVWYGRPAEPGYLWSCNRCSRRHDESDDRGFRAGGWTRTLADARTEAKRHRRADRHRWMRTVHEKSW